MELKGLYPKNAEVTEGKHNSKETVTLLSNFGKARHSFRKLRTDSTRENWIPLGNLVKHIPGFTRRNLSSRLSYHACPLRVKPHVENSIPFWSLHFTRCEEIVGVQGRATTVVRGLDRAHVLWTVLEGARFV